MAICKTCGKKYSKWTTPVSAHGVCGECFEAELSNEHEAEQQKEDALPAPLAQETPVRKPMVPIRWSSFLPRSRSKVVFVLVMGCYCIAVGSFMSTWTWVARLPRPPRAFYLRGDVPDVLGLLVFGPLIESIILVGVFELVRRVRRTAFRYSPQRSSLASCMSGLGGRMRSLCCQAFLSSPLHTCTGGVRLGRRLSGC